MYVKTNYTLVQISENAPVETINFKDIEISKCRKIIENLTILAFVAF